MLRELRIRNLAVIPEAELRWEAGFTAVTGETGAGKSILMNALKFILGAKAKPDLIRQGADKLWAEARFDLPPSPAPRAILERLGVDGEGDEIILERELSAAGKNRCRINGSVVNAAALEEIGSCLVDLHGQHQQQSLIDAATHLDFLDGFAKLEADRENYSREYRDWKDAGEKLRASEAEAARVREQYDFFLFQLRELEKAPLGPDQEERLESELKLQSSLEKVGAGLQSALSLLAGEDGDLLAGLSRLRKEMQSLSDLLSPDPFAAHAQTLETARESLADLRHALQSYRLPRSADAAKLDELNAQLALIQRLKSKYRADMAGLLELRSRRRREIDACENADADIQSLRTRAEEAFARAAAKAGALSRKRVAACKKFDFEVNARLQNLGMENAAFQTRIQSAMPSPEDPSALSPSGCDKLEFFLAANAGEAPKALRLIASGGEISRIMLAIKAALAQSDPRPLLVFDELDTGIGGVTANRVGEALKDLARHHQLIVITHLHQVAALADHQQKVVKDLQGGRTVTRVMPLNPGERVLELARMMGDEHSQATLKHARELLAR